MINGTLNIHIATQTLYRQAESTGVGLPRLWKRGRTAHRRDALLGRYASFLSEYNKNRKHFMRNDALCPKV